MALDAGKVVGTLELQDKWNTTLERAAANTNTFETQVTSAMTRASTSTDQLSRTTLTMSGRLAVAQAAARSIQGEIGTLSAAIVTSGGATAEESRRLNELTNQLRRVEGASAGFRATLDGVATRGADVANVGTALHQSFSRFDSLLASVGLNLGTEAKGLAEVAGAAGTATTELGLLGVAGLAIGTGIAAWKIGRAAAEFFDLDTKIGNATARMLGWGDAAAEAAAAKADVLAKASKEAGIQITDLGAAMTINAEAAQRHIDALNTSTARVEQWRAAIANVANDGKFLALVADIDANVLSLDELAKHYNTTTEAIQFFIRTRKQEADADSEAARIRQNNLDKLHKVEDDMAERRRAREAKATEETGKLWDDVFKLRVDHGGTANDVAIAQIQKWARDTETAAKQAGLATKGFYDALAADSREKMASVGIDWDLWRTKSIPALQEAADNALKTYNAMVSSGKFFREELDKQLAKYHELQDAARGYGKDSVAAQEAARKATEKQNAALEAQKKAEEAAAKAAANRALGGSFDVTSQNFEQTITGLITTGGRNPTGTGSNISLSRAYDLARQGYSLQEIVAILNGPGGPVPPPRGPRIPGFPGGGYGDFGSGTLVMLHGQEAIVPLPAASGGQSPIGGLGGVVVHIDNRGAWFRDRQMIDDLSRDVADRIMFITHLGRRFGTA